MKLHKLVIVAFSVSALLLPVTGFAGALDRGPSQQRYNQAADEMMRVPGVVGMYESDAMAVLQQSGVAPHIEYDKKFQEDLVGREGTVIDQEPGAGGITMLGSTVTITVYWPASMGPEPGAGDSSGQPANDGGGQWGEPGGAAPPPSNQAPAPQWGGSSQPASGGGWTPPPVPVPQPSVTPTAPQPAAPPPVSATPVEPTATQADQQDSTPSPVTAAPVQETVTPATQQPSNGPAPVTGTAVEPTATQTDQQQSSPPPVSATPVQPAATQAQQQESSPPPVSATPVQPTATRAGQRSSGPAPVAATPVEPTVTQAQQQESTSSRSNTAAQGSGSGSTMTIGATAVLPTATAQTEWQVEPWQTRSWATVYDGQGSVGAGVWSQLPTVISSRYLLAVMNANAAIGNAPSMPNQQNPGGGTSGTFAVTVETPIGELPCNKNAISNAPGWMRMGFFYSCMKRFPNTGNYFNSQSNLASLPFAGASKTGNIISNTYKRFLGGFLGAQPDNSATITVKKLGGRGSATVYGAMGDLGHFWRPWSCNFPRGKDNIGQTCSFTFDEVKGRFIGIQITGHSAVNSFKYEISVR